MTRSAIENRATGETDISVSLALDGTGAGDRRTGIGFFDHLLDALARHGALDLDVDARGDVETGAHHTVEDTGILIGRALDHALGDRAGIVRFGHAVVPMDEARASAAVDVSGRPLAVWEGDVPPMRLGDFESELAEEFVRAIASTARLTVHVRIEAGTNAHHVVEVAVKAFARALRAAVAQDPWDTGVPSTKGVL